MMVAYSFNERFVDPIRAGEKCQTIRAHRRRHAREGERVQLYTGMRTRRCKKILAEDPLCLSIEPVRFDLRPLTGHYQAPKSRAEFDPLLDRLTIDVAAERLDRDQRERLAICDGFGGAWTFIASGEPMSAFGAMVFFWMQQHGPILFEGVLIRWQNPHAAFYKAVIEAILADAPAAGAA